MLQQWFNSSNVKSSVERDNMQTRVDKRLVFKLRSAMP